MSRVAILTFCPQFGLRSFSQVPASHTYFFTQALECPPWLGSLFSHETAKNALTNIFGGRNTFHYLYNCRQVVLLIKLP
jgi:hypothetical protein